MYLTRLVSYLRITACGSLVKYAFVQVAMQMGPGAGFPGGPPPPNFFNLPPGGGMYPSMDPSQQGTRAQRDGSEAGVQKNDTRQRRLSVSLFCLRRVRQDQCAVGLHWQIAYDSNLVTVTEDMCVSQLLLPVLSSCASTIRYEEVYLQE